MGFTNSVPGFKAEINNDFLKKAEKYRAGIIKRDAYPLDEVEIIKNNNDWTVKPIGPAKAAEQYRMQKDSKVCFDFGNHYVGYADFNVNYINSPSDAPLHLKIKFGEKPFEIGENREDYDGLLSSGWIQEEYIHVDDLPAHIELPRRYAFRYMQIVVLDTSPCYSINITDVHCTSVSSADISTVAELSLTDKELIDIDRVSVRTMAECMQDVFEDGPKRDRRLWIGDLRLQSLVNYETFKNYALVKRCLYLIAGLTQGDGRLAACIFSKADPIASKVNLFDYSLLFISCVYDYYVNTKDTDTIKDLFPTIKRQIEIASQRFDENYIIRDSSDWWCFVDWNDDLNKQASAQAIFIYTAKQYVELSKVMGEDSSETVRMIENAADASMKYLWDNESGFFVSGNDRQISWASQIWFVLSGIMPVEENARLMLRMIEINPAVGIVTPYTYHYFIQALFDSGLKKEAVKHIKYYWGAMLADGADCFYEVFNPENKDFSPYGSRVINSYCHSWSGTPSYFIRRYLDK